MGLPTAFYRFRELPNDIRERIWVLAAGESLRPVARRLIPLTFTMAPQFALPSPKTATTFALNKHIRYTFRLSSPHFSRLNIDIWHSSSDAYRFYVKRNPNFVQLRLLPDSFGNRGQIIRFNAERDHVFMGPYSLFVMYMYALERDYFESGTDYHGFGSGIGLGPSDEQRMKELIGFEDIRVLETSLPNNLTSLVRDGRLLMEIFTHGREEIKEESTEDRGPALKSILGIRVSAGQAFKYDLDMNQYDGPWIQAMSEEIYQGLRFLRLRRSPANPMLIYLAHKDLVANIRDFLDWDKTVLSAYETEEEDFFYHGPVSRDVVWSLFSVEEPTQEEKTMRRVEEERLTRNPEDDDLPPGI